MGRNAAKIANCRLPIADFVNSNRQSEIGKRQSARSTSEAVAQTEAVITHDARRHRMPPTDVVDRYSKRRGQSLTFVGTWRPTSRSDRFNAFRRQLRSFGDLFDRQTGFFEQQINCSDRQDRLPNESFPHRPRVGGEMPCGYF